MSSYGGWDISEAMNSMRHLIEKHAPRYLNGPAHGECRQEHKPPTVTPPEMVQQFAHLHTVGKKNAAQIARQLGVAESTVVKHLKRCGVYSAKKIRKPTPITPELIAKFENLHVKAGLSAHRIGQELSVSGTTVREYLRMSGVYRPSQNKKPKKQKHDEKEVGSAG